MLRVFQKDIADPEHFIITLELVPGRESYGQSVDTVKRIAADAFADARISAVSVTDNPGGNPSLSPDVIGHEIFSVGMDVIIHFTCRDMNRAGIESRALQLAMMGMKNILALTGDYTGKGFGGRGTPVFDLDSVNLLIMLNLLNERIIASGDPDVFFTGAVVSPFKYSEGESFAQYAKLCRKTAAGARFIITQVGYDVRKFKELYKIQPWLDVNIPIMGSVYLLSPKVAHAMNSGAVPGVVIPDQLLEIILKEWQSPKEGLAMAIERTAQLAAILKGIGFRGIQIGGIHRSFDTVGEILDRMEKIGDDWPAFIDNFNFNIENGFYAFSAEIGNNDTPPKYLSRSRQLSLLENIHFRFLKMLHGYMFDFQSSLAPFLRRLCEKIDRYPYGRRAMMWTEKVIKIPFLDCQTCGDCGIQHVAFLCPESKCPKHIRNGSCGGSLNGRCEVFPDRKCVWFRAYQRWASINDLAKMAEGCIPPRMWELDKTSSWLNFHLKRDHNSASNRIAHFCRIQECRITMGFGDRGENGQ